MSQIYKALTSGPVPADVATSFVTDDATTAIPALNILNVLTDQSNTNKDSGLLSVADPDNGDNLYIKLSNRATSQIQTTDATETLLLSLELGVGDGTYIAEGNLIAYNSTDDLSAAYTFIGAARSSGGAATEIGIENKNIWEEGTMSGLDFTVEVSGNNLIVNVEGLAGKTIDWNGILTYRYIGAS